MTISKFLPFLCVTVVGAMCLTVRAQNTDNPAQAAARIAIAKELFAAQTTNAPAAPTDTQITNVPAAPTDTNVMTHPANDKEAQKQAALAAAQADQAKAATQTNNMANMDMGTTNITQSTTNSWASGTSSESQPAANATKDKKKKQEKPAPAAAAPKPVSNTDTNYIGGDLGMKRIAAPALPISSSKEERLQALLQKYQADQITPEEYHQQRAAILAEP